MDGQLVPRRPANLDRRNTRTWERNRQDQALEVSRQETELAIQHHVGRGRIELQASLTDARNISGHLLFTNEADRIVERAKFIRRKAGSDEDLKARLDDYAQYYDESVVSGIIRFANERTW